MADKWDGWTCIPGRVCGGSGFMRDAETEISRLRACLQRAYDDVPGWVDEARDLIHRPGSADA